jgi:3-oxoacyl-[acyl-carrier-protein] synthase II
MSIVISGIGVVSPLGIGRRAFWEALSQGRTGIGEIRRFDPGPDPPRLGAEVPEFAAREFLPAPLVRRMDRLSQMIGVASVLAAADGGFSAGPAVEPGDDLAVVVGSALGNLTESAQFLDRVFTKGPALANPMLFPNLVLNAPASQVSMALAVRGPNLTISAGEISGEAALEVGIDLLRRGRARAVIVAAGEELSEVVFHALKDFRYLSPRRGRRERSCPFDCQASGPVIGEGAAALLIETRDTALHRGARSYATIERFERVPLAASSAHSWPAAASPLRDLAPDLVFSGADSSPERDLLELSLLAALSSPSRPLYSLAGALGSHASQGLLTIAAAALCLSSGTLPPLVGCEQPRPEYPFRYPREPLRGAWSTALVIGTARGGAAAAVHLGCSPGAAEQ